MADTIDNPAFLEKSQISVFPDSQERVLTDDEFRLFRDLVHKECGIYLNDNKKDFLGNRVMKRLNASGQKSCYAYYRHITSPDHKQELLAFLDAVTINETFFYRNIPQFRMLRDKVLPEVVERRRRNREYALTIWSAGCATGEEPYSITMEVLETIPDAALWNIRVFASDISLRCLEYAQIGLYRKDKLRDLPPEYSVRYFRERGESFALKDNVKRYVIFDYHNLMHENGLSKVDIIFCRNVMIYFDVEDQKKLVGRFKKALHPEGYLFVGHAESLQGLCNGDFRFLCSDKGTVYQKVKG